MNKKNIKSIYDLRRRKYRLRKRTAYMEGEISDDFYAVTHPSQRRFYSYGGSPDCYENLPFEGIYRLGRTIRRGMDIVRLAASIYRDYRR